MGLNALNSRSKMFTLQLIGWGVILGISLFFSISSVNNLFDKYGLIRFSMNLTTLLLIYMLNYWIFIPKLLFADRRRHFFISNLVVIMLLLLLSYYLKKSDAFAFIRPEHVSRPPRISYFFLASDFINYALMVGLVTALRLSDRLQKSEEALKEAESARVKAELANLRSQINPHFLLNTLNNIYALTAIDTERAQSTIKELSDLLRYILYENLTDNVLLTKEIDFIKSYIELMSIRLPRKVNLTTRFDISADSTTKIAPLIFISLIENAFKHSVSANGEGFIEINFEENISLSQITLSIKNSNFAKRDDDKSGHGIGLEQVQRRLELLYANRYTWKIRHDAETYSSTLTINI